MKVVRVLWNYLVIIQEQIHREARDPYINTRLNYSKNKLAIQNSKASSNSSIGNVEIKGALKL